MKEYIDRLFDKELDFYLKTTRAVLVVGPKWCGKSTTCKRHAKPMIYLKLQQGNNIFLWLKQPLNLF
jgi:ABC-type cobalamin/Fe3+-siderophores transport system ATPase subunit